MHMNTSSAPPYADVVAVVMAAGDSSRLGTPKQLQRTGTETLLRHTLKTALSSGVGQTLVVLGAHAETLRTHIADLPVQIVEHPGWRSGLSSSLRAGLAAVGDRAEAVLFLVCDQPAISPALLETMLERWATAPAALVACDYGGTLGVPVLVPRAYFNELHQLQGDTGAKPILARHRERLLTVAFPEGSRDVDLPPAPVRAVIFDFGNVICSFDVGRFIQNLVRLTGKPPEELTRAIQNSMTLIMQFESGLVRPPDFIGARHCSSSAHSRVTTAWGFSPTPTRSTSSARSGRWRSFRSSTQSRSPSKSKP
jgi:molybdenum cofactor cytidylyltransferase